MSSYEVDRLDGDLTGAFEVRRRVFIEQQGVPEHVEMDGHDDEAVHFLARETDAGQPVGTARLRFPEETTGKAERVAVLAEHRGQGLGTRLMERVEQAARERGCSTLALNAQTAVEAFYHELGYETVGGEFEEAGIPHVRMEKSL